MWVAVHSTPTTCRITRRDQALPACANGNMWVGDGCVCEGVSACLYLIHFVPENHSTKTSPHTHFAPMSGPISWLTTMRLQGMSSFLKARISRALSLTPRTAGKERKGAPASLLHKLMKEAVDRRPQRQHTGQTGNGTAA